MPTPETLLARIKDLLNNDGTVIVSTYTRHVEYHKKHADMFLIHNGELAVKRGKSIDVLTMNQGAMTLVKIKGYTKGD